MAFDKGTVVELKSGGPKMTVVERATDGRYLCRWWREEDKREFDQQYFTEAELKRAD